MADFDLDKFLTEVEVEDDAEREVLKKVYARTKNQGMVLRQSEFDKKLNTAKQEAAATLQALTDKQATLDQLITDNIGYKGKVDASVEAYTAKTEKELGTLRAKAVKAAELAGYTLDDIEADELLTPPPKKAKGADIDLSELDKKYVTSAALERLATGQVNLIMELDEVKDTYQELYDKKLTLTQRNELLSEYGKDVALASRQGQTPPRLTATADRLFEFGGKRTASDEARLKKLVDDAEARGRQKAIQEMGESGLPTPRRAGENISPLLRDKTRKPTDPPIRNRGQAMALEALQKLRTA